MGQADGGLSVLRTFRLLRVLKLVRFMPALRRQLVVLMKTMDNVATFCMLLMLFIFIFRWALRPTEEDPFPLCRPWGPGLSGQPGASEVLQKLSLWFLHPNRTDWVPSICRLEAYGAPSWAVLSWTHSLVGG